MKQPSNDMRIKVKASFLSPSTNRMLKVGDEMNVEKNRFWLRRLKAGDVEQMMAASVKVQEKSSDKAETKTDSKKK